MDGDGRSWPASGHSGWILLPLKFPLVEAPEAGGRLKEIVELAPGVLEGEGRVTGVQELDRGKDHWSGRLGSFDLSPRPGAVSRDSAALTAVGHCWPLSRPRKCLLPSCFLKSSVCEYAGRLLASGQGEGQGRSEGDYLEPHFTCL